MSSATTQADPALVLNLLEAFRASKAMFVAVSLGIFDRLAQGPADLPTLTKDLAADRDALERLLNACVGLRLLEQKGGAYANSATAAVFLCRNSPRQLAGYIHYSNLVLWKLWAHLEDAIREGTHRWQQAFGTEGPIFAHLFRTEENKREFLLGLHGYGQISSPAVVAALDLSRFRRLVDLGGGTGHLAIAACQRYPDLHAMVFDLAGVIPLAQEQLRASPVVDRVEAVAGDFFTDPLPEGDLFALGRILHDWTEEKIAGLLRKIYDRLPAGGGLLVAEKLLDDDKAGPPSAALQSLNMLLVTEGKERSLQEYTTLLKKAGFSQIQGRRTNSPLDAVLAIKDAR